MYVGEGLDKLKKSPVHTCTPYTPLGTGQKIQGGRARAERELVIGCSLVFLVLGDLCKGWVV